MFVFNFLNTISDNEPRVVIADEDPAILEALQTTWVNTQVQNCYFHVRCNMIRHYKASQLDNEEADVQQFQEDINSVAYSRYTERANTLMDLLTTKYCGTSAFRTYMTGRKSTMSKWATCFKLRTFNFNSSTTGDIERHHGQIKQYLKDTTLRQLAQLPLDKFIEGLPHVLSRTCKRSVRIQAQESKTSIERKGYHQDDAAANV
jgi:hypothetical protein